MKLNKPDLVIHLASLFLASHTPADIERLITSNILFSTQLLEAMAEAGVTKFINTGTSWQHFESDREAVHPVNLYAATKSAFEAILQYYVQAKGFASVSLMLFDTYGPGDSRPKLIQLLLKTLRQGAPLSMSPGQQQIDLVYIDDVVEAFLQSVEIVLKAQPGTSERFTIETGAPISIQNLVAVINKVTGQVAPVTFGGRPYREREVMKPWSRGRSVPGWNAKISLEEGLRRLLEFQRSKSE
jgi:nucleoside-diphosphate-sugar epimerase